jgi:hypothetical protein
MLGVIDVLELGIAYAVPGTRHLVGPVHLPAVVHSDERSVGVAEVIAYPQRNGLERNHFASGVYSLR